MLRSLDRFLVITDHKNLEYFGKPRQLSERQMRWAQFLGKFPNIEIAYRLGNSNQRADALSRRQQDIPSDSSDERISRRFLQVFRTATAIATQDKPDLRIFRLGVKLQESIDSYLVAIEEEPQESQEPPNELETL